MSRQSENQCLQQEQVQKTAIYMAPSVYGNEIDREEALDKCREYIKKDGSLRLMRIYRDEKVEVAGGSSVQRKRDLLMPVGAAAWDRLMLDLETEAVEAVVFYTARMVAPTFHYLEDIARRFFFPCGIRFVDVCAGFDSRGYTAEEAENLYFKSGRSMYRGTVARKAYQKKRNRTVTGIRTGG